MGTDTQPQTTPERPGTDPYFYGWRMVPRWREDNTQTWEKVPLTEWDVLHPQEDDFIVQTDAHDHDVHYLKEAFAEVLGGRPGFVVLADHRVDWQDPRLGAHGPDVAVFEGLAGPWDRHRATFPVKDLNARPVLVVEVTSPSTRYIDTDEKVVEYHRAAVPVYVIADRREQGGRVFMGVIGYRWTPDGYVRLPADERNGVWVEPLRVWIKPEADRLVCLDADARRIPDRAELRCQQDETTRKLAELEAELRRLRGETTPNPDTPST